MQLCYFAADVEGSVGNAFPPVSSMVSVGLCVIGRPEENFYVEFQEISPFWDPNAEKIHGISREYLRRNGKDPKRAMEALNRWTRDTAGDAIPVFCAMPIAYDFGYVNWYFSEFGVPNPFQRIQDGRDLYRRIRGLERHEDAPRARIWEEFPTAIPHTHHALSDALEYEEVHGAMLRARGLL